MRTYLIVSLFIISIVSSCHRPNKYATQLAVADTLIHALYAYDTAKISGMTGVDPENIGEDDWHYQSKLRNAKKMLQKAGLPKSENYTIKEYPNNSPDLVDVIATLKTTGQTITVRFVKFLPADKIAFFELDGPIKF